MTFEDITKINASFKEKLGRKAVKIQGKDYVMVKDKINAFRELYPEGSIVTELLSDNNGKCIIRATVSDESGKVLGTGISYEVEGRGTINKSSYVENCETSAIGRAISALGIGIVDSYSSADELINAKIQQGVEEKIKELIKRGVITVKTSKLSTPSETSETSKLSTPSETSETSKASETSEPISKAYCDSIIALAEKVKTGLDEIIERYHVNTIQEMTMDQGLACLLDLRATGKSKGIEVD